MWPTFDGLTPLPRIIPEQVPLQQPSHVSDVILDIKFVKIFSKIKGISKQSSENRCEETYITKNF
jgi:hypothetical protein